MAAYSASKAGVIALTKSMGKELATSGVLINCIAPAALDTEMARNADPALVKIMIDKSPMQRLGTAEECAALVCWLASGEMRFSTGACFDLSGGRAVY
jgi:3-oxoacyl-[acyl-carrier protein] reductase